MGAALNNARNFAIAGVLSLGTIFGAQAQSPANNNDLLASNGKAPTETVDNNSGKKVVPLQVLSLEHATDEQRVQWFKDNGEKYPVMVEVSGANSDEIINFVGRNMRGLQYTGLSGLVLVITNDPPYYKPADQCIVLRKNGELYNIFENPDLDDIDDILLHDEIIALYNEVHGGDVIIELYPELATGP